MRGPTDWLPSLWMETFDDLLDDQLDYEDEWSFQFNYRLTDQLTPGERRRGWKICCPCSKAQFKCGSCGNTWFSARVSLLFRYRLRGGRGTVIMRPFVRRRAVGVQVRKMERKRQTMLL
ncbi:hypothetical protein OJAV_G00107910 [Oryzias javanicus]|uniref:3CxxC-type domain-containing protein n=1 Tax=Oryzias javanicus TaxID=123683 RepID=A0A437CVZ6_ORYJA|nr:hypothetical protein OJAV_G00107910 [Oryzias javanicus]